MEVDFDENGITIVGKHKIETGNVDSRLTAKLQNHQGAFLPLFGTRPAA
jgi:hypothetical protein